VTSQRIGNLFDNLRLNVYISIDASQYGNARLHMEKDSKNLSSEINSFVNDMQKHNNDIDKLQTDINTIIDESSAEKHAFSRILN
jgi:septal ring factor EnvC (AmiA/AmiB activator)